VHVHVDGVRACEASGRDPGLLRSRRPSPVGDEAQLEPSGRALADDARALEGETSTST